MPPKNNPSGKKKPAKKPAVRQAEAITQSHAGINRSVTHAGESSSKVELKPAAKFTPKELLYIYEYCSNGYNGTRAAKDAGYECVKENTYASISSENLRKPHIKAEINRILAEKIMERSEVIDRIGNIAKGSLNDYLVVKQEVTRPTIKVHLSVVIAQLRAKIEDQEKFIIRSSNMTDQRRELFEANIDNWLDKILIHEIELERNPAAYEEQQGPEVIVETVELDMPKLARDKERGIIKKIGHKRGKFEVELYDAAAALRDLGRHWGIFEKDNKQLPKPTVNIQNLNSQELNILLAMKLKASNMGTNGK